MVMTAQSTQTETLGVGSRVDHPTHGKGVVIRIHKAAYEVTFVEEGTKMIGKTYRQWDVIEATDAEAEVNFNDAEKALIKILHSWAEVSAPVQLGDKWLDGTLVLKPAEADFQSKEMPIDTFFHKIVMVRDRLRVMEQRINSSRLSDEEKVNLQQYITRIYGSLTSFNVLFKHKQDHFRGTVS